MQYNGITLVVKVGVFLHQLTLGMDQATFNGFSAVVFALIAVLHAIRLVYGWPAAIGDAAIPLWVSWLALIIAGYLAYSGYRLSVRRR